MKVILAIIAAFALAQGGSVFAAATSILQQIYGVMFYIIAAMAFCTFAVLYKGKAGGRWGCGCRENAEKDTDGQIEAPAETNIRPVRTQRFRFHKPERK